jgi:hypothetical protein
LLDNKIKRDNFSSPAALREFAVTRDEVSSFIRDKSINYVPKSLWKPNKFHLVKSEGLAAVHLK